jgi:hypothetical protein
MEQEGDISGAVSQEGSSFFHQGGEDKLSLGSIGQDLSGLRIDHFRVKEILVDMETILHLTFGRHARTRNFR